MKVIPILTLSAAALTLMGASCSRGTQTPAQPRIPATVPIERQTPQPAVVPTSVVKEFRVTARQFSFTPSVIEVNQGDKVRIVFTSQDVTHGFSLPEFGVALTASQGETKTAEFTASSAGSFTFRCSVYCGAGHSGMTGTFIVR